jgi:hypothetical protein
MTTVSFTPQGPSFEIQYTDDSTEVSVLAGGAPSWLVFNPDNTHACCVNFGFTDGDTEAIMPTNSTPGRGTVIGQRQQVVIHVPQCAYAAQVWVSVAGNGGTGNVFLTPGA